MKLQKEKKDNVVRIIFVPETEEEKLIMGDLRNHYFFGDSGDGTFPEYDGITSADNYVTSMRFKFNSFK